MVMIIVPLLTSPLGGSAGLAELLNRAQWCSADDQRGLLSKEHLMLPQFLQQKPLPEETAEGEDQDQRNRLAEESQKGSCASSCPPEAADAGPTPGFALDHSTEADTVPSLPGMKVPSEVGSTDGLPDSQGSGPARETVV